MLDELDFTKFWSKVDASGDCWEWTGKRDPWGYGRFHHAGQHLAHRVAYLRLTGSLPPGLDSDHLCRNRGCINPDHLEFVTSGVNAMRGFGVGPWNARKTHCAHGHRFAEANTRRGHRRARGTTRDCRVCNRAAAARYRARRAAP